MRDFIHLFENAEIDFKHHELYCQMAQSPYLSHFELKFIKDSLQILLPIISEFKRINFYSHWNHED